MEILSNIWTFILSIAVGFGMLFFAGFVLIMVIILLGLLRDKPHEKKR